MTISVIIPTIHRYPFLRQVLEDLAVQTRPVDEILIIDQTPPEEREAGFYEDFDTRLPIRVVYLTETRGTCVSRNLAISLATADYLLFFDDDLRFPPTLIQSYVEVVEQGYDVVHGGVRHRNHDLYKERNYWNDPVQQLIASPNFNRPGGTLGVASGNALVSREWVNRIGGFDRHYDNGMADDWDFGLKLFQQGARMIYHNKPAVQHLKAPAGGRRNMFITGWRSWLGSFRDFSPAWLAPLFYFYARYFSRVATRKLCVFKLLEVFSIEYRLFRYPWAVPVAVYWWFVAVTRAKQMNAVGPRTLGKYPQPNYEVWTTREWNNRNQVTSGEMTAHGAQL